MRFDADLHTMADAMLAVLPPKRAQQQSAEEVGDTLCNYCQHLSPDASAPPESVADGSTGPVCCKAFPHGIPIQIWSGEVLHTVPYAGDQGILFAPITAEGLAMEERTAACRIRIAKQKCAKCGGEMHFDLEQKKSVCAACGE